MNEHLENTEEILTQGETLDSKELKKDLSEESIDQSSPTEEVVEVQKDPRESAGVILKRERESQGMSLDVVHEVTKIPLDALRAIEEGYTIRMLSPFYYKGFLKMYADYLGINVSEVIEDYKEEELPEHIDKEVDEFQIPQWITRFFTRKRKRQIVVVCGILLALFLFFKIIGFFIGLGTRSSSKKDIEKAKIAETEIVRKETKKAVEKKKKEVRREPPKIAVPKVIVKVKPKVQPAPKPKSTAIVSALVAQKEIALTVRAKQNSWLRVKTDGVIVFQSTLRLGAVETWMADDEIEISGKNINQLEFELNGKMIGTLGRNDRNAKKVVITKNGLSVKN